MSPAVASWSTPSPASSRAGASTPGSRSTAPASPCPWCSMARSLPASPSTNCFAEGVTPALSSDAHEPVAWTRILPMPRPLRPIDDRLVYHVITRGNNRAPVFFEEGHYEAFLQALGDLKRRRPFEFYGYCL